MIKRFYLSLFFARRWYWLLVGIIGLFVFAYGFPFLLTIAELFLLFLAVVTLLDYVVLFTRRQPVAIIRRLPDRMSNGDPNPVHLDVTNQFPFPVSLRIIDELPDQLQERHFRLDMALKPGESRTLDYVVHPKERGEYIFHNINVFIKSPFGLLIRRKILPAETMVRVLPSFLTLRQYELLAASDNLADRKSVV